MRKLKSKYRYPKAKLRKSDVLIIIKELRRTYNVKEFIHYNTF